MKAIMIMYDSLNRELLSAYGCDWTKTPNFKRLQEHSVVFDQCYVGSMPCMPARRELHTGRYNFLHRSWGPIEPFDDSMPEILKQNGVTSHLISDHQHYWEDGGCTYHPRYSSWEITRGQEGDPWKCIVDFPFKSDNAFQAPAARNLNKMRVQDQINRSFMSTLEKTCQGQTFGKGLEFLDLNYEADQWFLQIETFDPHEPFFSLEEFKRLYPHAYDGENADWPPYYFVREDEGVIAHTRYEYAALLSMCDYFLGKVLDRMDEYDLWKDTMLIVNTDHGYLLGEHGWWSKTVMPLYNEIAHTPLFIWDPRNPKMNERRSALVQTIDLAPTILDYFNLSIPKDMEGKALGKTIDHDEKVRDYAYFGYHGAHVNVFDGQYVYMRAPYYRKNHSLYEYTLIPTHMRDRFHVNELQSIEMQAPFTFTKGCSTMKIAAKQGINNAYNFGNKLFDVLADEKQVFEIADCAVELKMLQAIRKLFLENDAPLEIYEHYGILKDRDLTEDELALQKKEQEENDAFDFLVDYQWVRGARNGLYALLQVIPVAARENVKLAFIQYLQSEDEKFIYPQHISQFIKKQFTNEQQEMLLYFTELACRVR